MLVAVVMLFVVGAMAALSIDAVTIYTARSEAQLAADGAALAAARVLANSGATSDAALMTSAWSLAQSVALQVAEQNQVGGANLTASQITIPAAPGGTNTNPTFTISVQVTNLPTFFARIWGSRFITVGASATAEAYNPSGTVVATGSSAPPVAPLCVKPWLLPNMDPTSPPATPTTIFDPASGAITNTSLLGWTSTVAIATRMSVACPGGDCSGTPIPPGTGPVAWKYYPGDQASFPAPATALPTCSLIPTPTPYQESIAGCVQTPIPCNSASVNIDTSAYATRDLETAEAVNCLTHATAFKGDTVTSTNPPSAPFQFVAGDDNPITGLAGNNVMVSDSLVTVPVFNSVAGTPPTSPVTILGFVQLFLNPDGFRTPETGGAIGQVKTTVINMAGCGTRATGTPILGNGASPVAVRLISPP